MQARRISRELALLGISQLPTKPERLKEQDLQAFILAAVRALTSEVRDTLETAATELERASDRLQSAELQAINVQVTELKGSAAMVQEAIELTKQAINRLGGATDLPEFIQLANQDVVREYALQILLAVHGNRDRVDELLNQSMVDWQMSRLAKIDRDILRVAVVEILVLETPTQVAINEAVELAKRYSSDNGHRFINGVLRRVVNQQTNTPIPSPRQQDSNV